MSLSLGEEDRLEELIAISSSWSKKGTSNVSPAAGDAAADASESSVSPSDVRVSDKQKSLATRSADRCLWSESARKG